MSPEIFAREGGLSRRQVKEAVAMAVEQSGFTDTHKHWKIDAWAIKTMIMNVITKPDFVSYCCCNLPYHRAKKRKTARCSPGRSAPRRKRSACGPGWIT